MLIETILFTGVTTEDEKLAIQTCPYIDAALERSARYTYDEITVARSKTNCPQKDYCTVSLTYEPIINRLIIRGKCLME